MKGPLVAVLVAILMAGAGSAYLFLYSPSTSSGPNSTSTSQPSSTTISISQTTTVVQVTNATAHVTANIATCIADNKACTVTLVNTGGAAVEATGCTLNGQSGVFAPMPSKVPPGGRAVVSCAPSAGGALPVPGFHVGGSIQLSDGSSITYVGIWA